MNHLPTMYAPDFELFWTLYPRKIAKGDAFKAYRAAIKRGFTHYQLCDGARRYAAEAASREPKYVAHPATWINGDRCLDEPDKSPITTDPSRHGARSFYRASDHPEPPSGRIKQFGEVIASLRKSI